MKIPFSAWLIQGIPEIIGMVFLAISLATCQAKWKTILKGSLILSIVIYFIRLLPFTIGVHSLVLLALMSVILIQMEKIETRKSVAISVVVAFLLLIFEFAFNTLIISLGLVTDEQINSDPYIWIITGYPQIFYLFALAWINTKYKLSEAVIARLLDKRSVVK